MRIGSPIQAGLLLIGCEQRHESVRLGYRQRTQQQAAANPAPVEQLSQGTPTPAAANGTKGNAIGGPALVAILAAVRQLGNMRGEYDTWVRKTEISTKPYLRSQLGWVCNWFLSWDASGVGGTLVADLADAGVAFAPDELTTAPALT